jgi:hypothetical protein
MGPVDDYREILQSPKGNDGGRQRNTSCPLLYRYRLTHTYCSLARLPPTHPFLLGALILQRHFQVRWRAPCSHPQTGPPDSATSPVIVLYSRALCACLCVLALPPSPAGFLMSAHLSRLRLFQRHLRSLVWVGVWVWDWIHSHSPPRTRSPSSRHPLFTHYPLPPRSLLCGGQPSPHKPRLVVSHSTCPPLTAL